MHQRLGVPPKVYDQSDFQKIFRKIEIYLAELEEGFKLLSPSVPVTITAATYSVKPADTYLIANYAGTVTLSLLRASLYKGRELRVRTITAHTVVSVASDVVPLIGGSAGTAILAATAGKWATLVSDGAAWQVMAGN